MPTVQLNVHSKKLFLQHASKKLTGEEDVISPAFYKFLLPNNTFLRIARQQHIYTFGFSCDSRNSNPWGIVLFKNPNSSARAILPASDWQTIKRIISLLRPSLLYFELGGLDHEDELIEEIVQLVNGIECKIYLRLITQSIYLLNSWSSKLSEIDSSHFHPLSDCIPLELDYLKFITLSTDELTRIMSRHKIKTLDAGECLKTLCYTGEPIIDDGKPDKVENLWIEIGFRGVPELLQLLMEKGAQLKELKMLCTCCYPSDFESAEEVLNEVDRVWKAFLDLKEESRGLTDNLILKLDRGMSLNGDLFTDNNLIEQLKQHEMLNEYAYIKDEDGEDCHKFVGHFKDDFAEFHIDVPIYKYPEPVSMHESDSDQDSNSIHESDSDQDSNYMHE